MTQLPPDIAFNGSRLVRFLADLSEMDVDISHDHFVDRLSRLVDLSHAISLAETVGELPRMKVEPSSITVDTIQDECIQVRGALVQSIIKSFHPAAGPSLIQLPKIKPKESKEKLMSFEPYQRFYLAHQRDIHYKIANLQDRMRVVMSSCSPELAQLSALDKVLAEAIAAHVRRYFMVIPKLLAKRHAQLRQGYMDQVAMGDDDNPALWTQPGGWLDQFYVEMQGLLLAELDVRLQPVLGLLEALIEEIN